MVTVTSKKREAKTRRVKYRGIVRIASELGVSRQHAYLVAEGKRHSPRVTRALRKLKEAA